MPRDEKRDPAYLWDMLDAAKAITAFVAKFRLPDVGRVFAGNFGNGDGTFFVKMEKIW